MNHWYCEYCLRANTHEHVICQGCGASIPNLTDKAALNDRESWNVCIGYEALQSPASPPLRWRLGRTDPFDPDSYPDLDFRR